MSSVTNRAACAGPISLRLTGLLHQLSFEQRLSMLVRRNELWLVLVAAGVGAVAGLTTELIRKTAHFIQMFLFGIGPDQRLSDIGSLHSPFLALMPLAGGALMVLLSLWIKHMDRRLVDPVEANALHGGRMSFRDSALIVFQTLVSNGFGGSVGLEAAYTQFGAALGSKLAGFLHARRGDFRLLVGCGAAAAIAAAFNTPLAGAFYGLELIIATYTISALAPVMAASISAVLVTNLFGEDYGIRQIALAHGTDWNELGAMLALAVITVGAGIALMVLCERVERCYARLKIRSSYRPVFGGLLLAPVVFFVPEALSSGHGAMGAAIASAPPGFTVLLAVIGGKMLASAISIGSGFRGGLFFASLFLGTLVGELFYVLVNMVWPGALGDPAVAAIVGMTGLAAAVVGGPLTMGFLALELYGSLPLATLVLASAVISSMAVRSTFGYSFTTWRFHLRGETIRSAHDVGLVRNLTVGRMMRRDVKTIPATASLREFSRSFPLGSTTRVIVVDDMGNYAGMVSVSDVFTALDAETEGTVADFVHQCDVWLEPKFTAKQAAHLFEQNSCDSLAVIACENTPNVIGLLNETHLLRRYAQELDKIRADMMGIKRGVGAPRRAG